MYAYFLIQEKMNVKSSVKLSGCVPKQAFKRNVAMTALIHSKSERIDVRASTPVSAKHKLKKLLSEPGLLG